MTTNLNLCVCLGLIIKFETSVMQYVTILANSDRLTRKQKYYRKGYSKQNQAFL